MWPTSVHIWRTMMIHHYEWFIMMHDSDSSSWWPIMAYKNGFYQQSIDLAGDITFSYVHAFKKCRQIVPTPCGSILQPPRAAQLPYTARQKSYMLYKFSSSLLIKHPSGPYAICSEGWRWSWLGAIAAGHVFSKRPLLFEVHFTRDHCCWKCVCLQAIVVGNVFDICSWKGMWQETIVGSIWMVLGRWSICMAEKGKVNFALENSKVVDKSKTLQSRKVPGRKSRASRKIFRKGSFSNCPL